MAYPTTLVYQVISPMIGAQPIASISTTQNHPLGTIIRANETSVPLGEGEFIYLKGVASTAKGDAVTYDTRLALTTRLVDDGIIGPVAVAMGANVASSYGWYQISGIGVVAYLTNAAINLEAYVTATAGAVSSDIVTGDIITGMQFSSAAATPTAGFVYVLLQRPFVALV